MKEKAMIFSDYRQPYNFLAHEEASPVDSSTPLPSTSKADSYPRRHKRPSSFQDPAGPAGFNLRKHNSESAFPMQRLNRRWATDSPRQSSSLLFPQGNLREGSIREEPLQEEDEYTEFVSPSGSQRPSVAGSDAGGVAAKDKTKKKKFWRRKSKESLDLENIQEGQAVTPESPAELESPKKKKRFFGKKSRSRTSLDASQEELGATATTSGQQIQDEPNAESADELNEPKTPDTPSKKKKFWKRRKSGSASLGPAASAEGGISGDDGISGATETQEGGEIGDKKKRGSILRRLSKSGSRSSLSKSEDSLNKEERVSTDENLSADSPKKRRSSLLGRLSKSGSRSSLSKSEDSIEGELAASTDNNPELTPKRKSSILRKLSKSSSRKSSKKPDDGPSGTSGQPAGDEGTQSKQEDIDISTGGQGGSDTSPEKKKGSIIRRLSRSGSKTSLSKSEGDLRDKESISPRKKKGLFGKKKTSSRTSLNEPEEQQP